MIDATLRHQGSTRIGSSIAEQVRNLSSFPSVVSESLSVDPIGWLQAQDTKAKFVWSDRGGSSITVGAGVAGRVSLASHASNSAKQLVDECRKLLFGLPEQVRMFGGFAFAPGQNRHSDVIEWERFGNASFWLPRATYQGGRLNVVVRDAQDADAALEFVENLKPGLPPSASPLPALASRTNRPDFDDWKKAVSASKQMFDDEVLEKIVLARKVELSFEADLDPLTVFHALLLRTPACYHFCFEIDGVAFLGATPERLFSRRERGMESEVVAGTRPRGRDEDDDEALGNLLLASRKDQLEHDIVRKSIRQRLHALVSKLDVDASASLLKLATKQHLFSRVTAELLPGVHDGELISRLHPTPAVGGYPTENALSEIARLEPFARGWYAAPVGWISNDSIELAVAIRSGLVDSRNISLYSGAGIVPGSDVDAEWDEVEHKISDFLTLFPTSQSAGKA